MPADRHEPPRSTLGDYLTDADPIGTLWPDLVNLAYRDGPRSINLSHLSQPARTLYLAGVLRGEIYGGGFSTFFSNTSGDHVPETVQALAALGAERCANVLDRALMAFGGQLPPADRAERCEILFAFEASQPDTLEELDSAFYAIEKELHECERRYLHAHADAPVAARR